MSQALTLDESATVFTNIRAGAQHILDLIAEKSNSPMGLGRL
jgi:hypothetical protein